MQTKEKGSRKIRTKKRHSTMLVLVWALLSVVCGSCEKDGAEANSVALEKLPYTFDFGGPAYGAVSLVFEGSYPNLPAEMMVYKVNEPNVTEAYARELGRKYFGIGPDASLKRSRGMGLYWLRGKTWRLEVDPTNGSLNVAKIGRVPLEPAAREKFPSDEQCVTIATEYLRMHGLLGKDAYFRGIADNTSGSGVMSLGFGRLIGGYKSWGAGGRMLVDIGAGGEVVDVWKAWQKLIPYKAYPVKTPEKALEELRSRKGMLAHGSKGKVNQITFRYYTSPEKQEYVQPIYYFDCNGPRGNFYGVVPAIKDEYLKARPDSSPGPIEPPKPWIKCRSAECQAAYQMDWDELLSRMEDYLDEHPDWRGLSPVVCKVCGRESAYPALKCGKCGLVFDRIETDRYYDRCPKCKYSRREEVEKKDEQRKAAGGGRN